MVSKEKKTKGFYTTVAEPSGILSDLVPYSRYKMYMVVANNHFESPPSNTVEFTTKEGGEDAALAAKILHCGVVDTSVPGKCSELKVEYLSLCVSDKHSFY